jgi:integrase
MVSAKPMPMDALQHGQELNPSQSIGTGTLDVEGRVIKNLSITRPDELETIPALAPGRKPTGHQKRKPGRRKVHPRNKANWLPNKFGRYPVSSAVKKYLEATRKYYAPSTQKERARKTKYIARILGELGISNNPQDVTNRDVIKFLDWMDDMKLGNAHKRRLLRYFRDYLAYYDNDIVSLMISKKQVRVPSEISKDIRSMTQETVLFLHEATKNMTGWRGTIARFITMAYPYTGLRPSELRTLKYEDLDQADWTIRVSHPKGEGVYGQNRRAVILPQAIPAFKEFLQERADYLKGQGKSVNTEPLIPYMGRYGLTYWGSSQLNILKMDIEKLAGVKFKTKDYRATFCQMAIDKGAELPAVSKMMGHKTTMTTEAYYGRIRDDSAIQELRRAFKEPDVLSLIQPRCQ